ncbi:hypothetical protein T492DRAFT_220463 [Pavlovales sp. CCMP2436]|nr:hypothetical protein T492DRAFT_220463 [Pavlovales sp. CCMP2436]
MAPTLKRQARPLIRAPRRKRIVWSSSLAFSAGTHSSTWPLLRSCRAPRVEPLFAHRGVAPRRTLVSYVSRGIVAGLYELAGSWALFEGLRALETNVVLPLIHLRDEGAAIEAANTAQVGNETVPGMSAGNTTNATTVGRVDGAVATASEIYSDPAVLAAWRCTLRLRWLAWFGSAICAICQLVLGSALLSSSARMHIKAGLAARRGDRREPPCRFARELCYSRGSLGARKTALGCQCSRWWRLGGRQGGSAMGMLQGRIMHRSHRCSAMATRRTAWSTTIIELACRRPFLLDLRARRELLRASVAVLDPSSLAETLAAAAAKISREQPPPPPPPPPRKLVVEFASTGPEVASAQPPPQPLLFACPPGLQHASSLPLNISACPPGLQQPASGHLLRAEVVTEPPSSQLPLPPPQTPTRSSPPSLPEPKVSSKQMRPSAIRARAAWLRRHGAVPLLGAASR